MADIGRKVWAIAEGYIPSGSVSPQRPFQSHETACLLNPNDRDAQVTITVFFKDRAPAGPYRVVVPRQRTLQLRFNDLHDPEPVPRDTDYASVIESTVPIIVQHTRLEEIRSYKGPPSLAITEHWNYCDTGKDFFGGYSYMSQGPLPILWASTLAGARGLWGQRLIDEMEKYNHQVGLKIVGETLPQERNQVTLADEKDRYGLPIARVTYSFCDNDKRLIEHSLNFMSDALAAAGARDIWRQTDDTCHLNGTARMGDDPASSVVDADCRSWDIPNLWICDGSVFPTVGGVNPSLTIQAIACRTGDRIRELAARGELERPPARAMA